MGHVLMMGAIQPFISGAISKTVNVPNEATVDDVMDTYVESWKAGVKAIAIYRDGSKAVQPLSTSSSDSKISDSPSPLAERGPGGEVPGAPPPRRRPGSRRYVPPSPALPFKEIATGLLCPDCGSQLVFAEGCLVCRSCGYTKCG
jgi:ribonucleoside-diphosphate reductase alpha chain